MPTDVQMQVLIHQLRAEVGHSTNVAQGTNFYEVLVQLLQRTQRALWVENDWPDLTDYYELDAVPGQRYYPYPTDVSRNQVNKIWAPYGSDFHVLVYGISPREYTAYDPNKDQRSWPTQRWKHKVQNGQIELWPLVSQSGRFWVEAQMNLKTFVDPTDVCTLDGDMIVLFAAAEILARQRMEDAAVKRRAAETLRQKLLTQEGSDRRAPFIIGGSDARMFRPRPGLDYIPSGYGKGG